MTAPHKLIIIDGDEFTRGMFNCFFKRDRVRDQVELLEELKSFSSLMDENSLCRDARYILFNYRSCLQNLEKNICTIRKSLPHLKFISTYFEGNVFELDILLKSGVNAILANHHSPMLLLDVMDTLSTQEHYLNDFIDADALGRIKRNNLVKDDGLTMLEICIIRFITKGLSRKHMGKSLDRSEHTIEKDISIIHSKTGTKTDMQLLRYAILHGHVRFNVVNDSAAFGYNKEGQFVNMIDG